MEGQKYGETVAPGTRCHCALAFRIQGILAGIIFDTMDPAPAAIGGDRIDRPFQRSHVEDAGAKMTLTLISLTRIVAIGRMRSYSSATSIG